MGHIRLGRLPKTRRWSGVFALLEGESVSPEALARVTATAAQEQFAVLQGDQAINYCSGSWCVSPQHHGGTILLENCNA